jgi:hypothetical protein
MNTEAVEPHRSKDHQVVVVLPACRPSPNVAAAIVSFAERTFRELPPAERLRMKIWAAIDNSGDQTTIVREHC